MQGAGQGVAPELLRAVLQRHAVADQHPLGGAAQPHVEQPEALPLLPRLPLGGEAVVVGVADGGELAAAGADVEGVLEVGLAPVEVVKRHHRPLEPLAAVQGVDPHRVEAALGHAGLVAAAQVLEVAQQELEPAVAALGHLEEQLVHVGAGRGLEAFEVALAVQEGRAHHPLEELERRQGLDPGAELAQAAGHLRRGALEFGQRVLGPQHALHRLLIQPPKRAAQEGGQAVGVAGVEGHAGGVNQVAHLDQVVKPAPADDHVGDFVPGERPAEERHRAVAAHQHGHLAPGVAVFVVAGGQPASELVGLVGAQPVEPALPANDLHLHPARARTRARAHRRGLLAAEGLGPLLRHPAGVAVQEGHHVAVVPPAHLERRQRLAGGHGAAEDAHVGVAEGVDGLLGVAHHLDLDPQALERGEDLAL